MAAFTVTRVALPASKIRSNYLTAALKLARRLCSVQADVSDASKQRAALTEEYVKAHFEGSDTDTLVEVTQSMAVYDDFVTPEEETTLIAEIEPQYKRLRYESSHWDDAIHGYREIERNTWSPPCEAILGRIRALAFTPEVNQIQHVHCLDLLEDGHIKPHVDSVRFCGDTIAGLSLLSSSIMKLVHEKNPDKWVKILLRRRSLYIMRGTARYDYTHEILANQHSVFRSTPVHKSRRISVMCRNEPS
ncbi:alpha-ketoglutarate-dependent dioxygenase alkB homolog 7, mitochondrial-like [Dermacentor silvarum]|uniref:alpha-ketoglutarate-dependent dioxygenase alkB homolog 7, mitochondrial-like n=1 Tax=Dermacentor silvarum TaxID=543639 RepID=UPI0018983369|nr:alpha-ketoglutarate-dependent dioxygenase alkB homolog 7, mitochondrial-like [Dermacentor silvarum]